MYFWVVLSYGMYPLLYFTALGEGVSCPFKFVVTFGLEASYIGDAGL